MRHIIAIAALSVAALVVGQAQAADLPQYSPPPMAVPAVPVNYGLGGSFYLRGSVGLNAMWANHLNYDCTCGLSSFGIDKAGYGYSIGAGFGYEAGNGLRFDATLDYLSNEHLKTAGASNIDLSLRSTIAMANAYYDFKFDGHSLAEGGFGGYVGAGLGGAYNYVSDNASSPAASGHSFSPAAAIMAGVSYDMGSAVADLGYRGIYMPDIHNDALNGTSPQGPYYLHGAFINEIRASLRYRLD